MSLHVDKPDSLQAEILQITATQLIEHKIYKLMLKLNHQYGSHYAYVVFQADAHGTIDVSKMKPIRGTYTDTDPMGLFSSQTPTPEFAYGGFLKCTPPVPFIYELRLYDAKSLLLDSVFIKRHWKHPKLERIEVEENGVFGSLYKPPGNGPFPCLIDFSGVGGGLQEQKGCMLASEGFVTLCLPFFQFKSLPCEIEKIHVEYFIDAIDYLISLPYTTDYVGLHGLSFGGTLVDLISTKHQKVRAVVSLNGPHLVFQLNENQKPKPFLRTNNKLCYFLNGVFCTDKQFSAAPKPSGENKIPFEQAEGHVAYRFVASMDDLSVSSVKCVLEKYESLRKSGHKHVEMEFVNGGHLLYPPYLPHHEHSFLNFFGMYGGLGGQISQHGKSQEQVWKRTIEFFKKHLGTPPKMPEWDRMQHITSSCKM